ncbi:MAG: HD family hydrolase [Faecousia sp.]
MKPKELLEILSVAEKLKCNTRHCFTSSGRHESVAEHSWRISLMAMLITGEFPEADMDKVIRMCLIHDLGEAFTGDIPTFEKTAADTRKEDNVLLNWVKTLPEDVREEFTALLAEMNALETREAKIYKALDKMEAVIQHNESDISTWLPLEYDLQLTYGEENVQFSPYMRALKAEINDWTKRKIANERQNAPAD